MIPFIKNSIRNISRVFPNIISNKVDYEYTKIPRHWKITELHGKDIQKDYCEIL